MVQFIGICDEDEEELLLVQEYVGGGDLRSHLKNKHEEISWKIRAKISYDVACAMAYLHSRKIMHRDLKSKNLLIGSNWKTKLCDFGFARRISATGKAHTICGTEDWMAPEVILGLPYDYKADVFSYGIVLLEIITRRKVKTDFSRFAQTAFALNVDKIRTFYPEETPQSFLKLAEDCCEYNPQDRPSFSSVIKRLVDVTQECETAKSIRRSNSEKSNSSLFTSFPSLSKSSKEEGTLSPLSFDVDDNTELLSKVTEVNERLNSLSVSEKVSLSNSLNEEEDSQIESVTTTTAPSNGTPLQSSSNSQKLCRVRSNSLSKKENHTQTRRKNRPRSQSLGGKIMAKKQLSADISKLQTIRLDRKEALEDALNSVFWLESFSGWLILGYSDKATIHLQNSGTNGVDQMLNNLKDDQIQYILLRIGLSIDEGGNKKTRDIFIHWIGKDVPITERGIKTAHVGQVMELLKPFHAELTAVSKNNFTYETILSRSAPLSGSHVID